jgi:hypothetical protein
VCAEASTALRAVAADFFFNCWYLEISSDNRIRHVPRCIHYNAQRFRFETFKAIYVGSGSCTPKLYSISVDWFLYCFIYFRNLLLVESFDLRPSNQYILARVIPSCLRFFKMKSEVRRQMCKPSLMWLQDV